jgi:molybdopterin-dependent oxidoreductase alpha subunit
MSRKPEAQIREYKQPAGGRGAVKSALNAFRLQGIPVRALQSFVTANKPGGFDCPGCAFPDKNGGALVDSCEQGQKAIAWEMTKKRADSDFFARRPLAQLRELTDHELESVGRLTHPLFYDAGSDTYVPIDWQKAFEMIGTQLREMRPESVVFYASGRSSNEAAFLWQLLARAYGTNNLPDSSNLCHEPSGAAMKEAIGIGKGTCSLDDFEHADLIMVLGQNPATNHPRMMGALHEASRRGATVIALNPLKELGFTNFSDPKNAKEMLTNTGRQVAKKVYQVRIGGDLAALKGVIRVVLDAERYARAHALPSVLDRAFINENCAGFDAFCEDILNEDWNLIECESGLSRAEIEEIGNLYLQSKATMATWCMGITHHENAHATIQMILNLLLLKGNIGRSGAGAAPIRGHSNVQGDRTMGITINAPERFLKNLEQEFSVALPRTIGKDAMATVRGLIDGSVRGLFSLGGNFGAAVPDSQRALDGLRKTDITVHIATKLNRTHLYPGRIGLLLPSLGRTDIDVQKGGEQIVTVEDSMSVAHSSRGIKSPESEHMRSEPDIVASIAHHVMPRGDIAWLEMAADYDRIRDHIERSQEGVFEGFRNFNRRIREDGRFWLTNWATKRIWKTSSGKAEFKVHAIDMNGPVHRARRVHGDRVLALMTIRSHDQFNTTVYGNDDRYRGVFGGRHVVFISREDLGRLGFRDGDYVDIRTCSEDGVPREVKGFRLVRYDIPAGCIAAYFPEANPLIPSTLVSKVARTPAYKEVPVLLSPAEVAAAGGVPA